MRIERVLLLVLVLVLLIFGIHRVIGWTQQRAQEVRWQETAAGIEVGTVSVPMPVTAVRIDSTRATLRVIDMHKGVKNAGGTVQAVCPKAGAAINASYFAEDLSPIGLVVVDGRRIQRLHTSGSWGIFLVRHGKPALVSAGATVPRGVTQAIQCKPRLVIDGKVPTFRAQGPARRSAIGMDKEGHVLFLATDRRVTLEEWAACLRDIFGCVNALNLDGGPSTQLAVRGRRSATVNGGWPVPVFITAEPK